MTFVDGRETIAYDHLYTFGAFATTVRLGGQATKTVVLWANFFGGLNPNPRDSQVVTLIHELIHSALNAVNTPTQDGHVVAVARLGIRIQPYEDASAALNRWIAYECRNE